MTICFIRISSSSIVNRPLCTDERRCKVAPTLNAKRASLLSWLGIDQEGQRCAPFARRNAWKKHVTKHIRGKGMKVSGKVWRKGDRVTRFRWFLPRPVCHLLVRRRGNTRRYIRGYVAWFNNSTRRVYPRLLLVASRQKILTIFPACGPRVVTSFDAKMVLRRCLSTKTCYH